MKKKFVNPNLKRSRLSGVVLDPAEVDFYKNNTSTVQQPNSSCLVDEKSQLDKSQDDTRNGATVRTNASTKAGTSSALSKSPNKKGT